MRGKTVSVKCKCCPDMFEARVADRKRGWGLFCSKSCKSYWQEYKKGRPHQTPEMRELARLGNEIMREVNLLNRREPVDFDALDAMSDMDYGASDGGGYTDNNGVPV